MNVLIDTNVILDVLLERQPWLEQALLVWKACDDGRVEGWVSPITLTTIFYVGRKQFGKPKALEAIATCLSSFQICPVSRETIQRALQLNGADFEDDVQCACAEIGFMDAIVTRDASGYATSPVPAWTPQELLTRLPS